MQLLPVAIDLDRALVTSRRTSSPNSGGTTFCWLWCVFTSLTCSTSWTSRRSNVLILGLSSSEARSCTYYSRNGHSQLRIGGENLCLYAATQTRPSIYQESSHWRRFIHTILSNIPGLASICLPIPSKDKTGGLCSVLKLINPKHLILRDSNAWRNQGVSNVIDVLMTSVWSNLVRVPLDMFCFPHVLIVLLRFHTNILMMNICGSITFLGPVTVHVICALQI